MLVNLILFYIKGYFTKVDFFDIDYLVDLLQNKWVINKTGSLIEDTRDVEKNYIENEKEVKYGIYT